MNRLMCRFVATTKEKKKQDALLMAFTRNGLCSLMYSPLYASQIFTKYPPFAIEIIKSFYSERLRDILSLCYWESYRKLLCDNVITPT